MPHIADERNMAAETNLRSILSEDQNPDLKGIPNGELPARLQDPAQDPGFLVKPFTKLPKNDQERTVGKTEWEDRWRRKYTGLYHLDSVGARHSGLEIMFVAPCALTEEMDCRYSPAAMLKGGAANLFRRNLGRAGIGQEQWGYTTLVRYNVDKLKPKAADVRWSLPLFAAEIKRRQPKLIVCLGKAPFDLLFTDVRLSVKDIQGAFFTADGFAECEGIPVYPMDTLTTPYSHPEYVERVLADLRNINEFCSEKRGVTVVKLALDYHVLETAASVEQWRDDMIRQDIKVLSTDAEWRGKTFIDGELRSVQYCHKPGSAVYVKITDEHKVRTMDVDDEILGEILKPLVTRPDFRYVGHNAPADFVWFEEKFKLDCYQRLAFDTMFAQQLINEYADLKLERLSVNYTDLGRYDVELLMWKKKSQDFDEDQGYGQVPDKILIPYALRDVDVTLRAYPVLLHKLLAQGPALWSYFSEIMRPFTSDCYVQKMRTGLPVDIPYLDVLRDTFQFNRDWLRTAFKIEVKKEAATLLLQRFMEADPVLGISAYRLACQLKAQYESGTVDLSVVESASDTITAQVAQVFGDRWRDLSEDLIPVIEHWLCGDEFNYNSAEHLKRWMFKVKRLKPLKTTKRDGMQLAWDKVLEMDKQRQKEFSPAVDKQTIKIHSEGDPLVSRIMELKSVDTMCKTFLREGEKCMEIGDDGEQIEVVKEKGIHKWVCSDGFIHANFACTETGRPRTWSPNILNWPKSVSKPIEAGFQRINEARAAQYHKDRLEEMARTNIVIPDDVIAKEVERLTKLPVSLRSCIKAPAGMCFVDADLATAEVVGLGYLSGDANLVSSCEDPDPQFGYIIKNKGGADLEVPTRIAYLDDISPMPVIAKDPELLYTGDPAKLLRNPDGSIRYAKRDVHWQMAESYMARPRERLSKDLHRGAGKIGMFSIPYGASPTLIERNIEVLVGKKPDTGTGQAIIDAYKASFPVATGFLENQERIPEEGDSRAASKGYEQIAGQWQSVSGRIRHFKYLELADLDGVSPWTRKSLLSSMSREARNYPLQEIVAATMARAHIRLLDHYRKNGMKARPMLLLYDALTVLCPLEERWEVKKSLQTYMSDTNTWPSMLEGKPLQFDIDVDFSIRWATDPEPDEKKLLYAQ